MVDRRRIPPVTYGADYTRNLRWRYRTTYGEGSYPEPIRGGGSFGRGYERAGLVGPRSPRPGPPIDYDEEYRRGRRRRRSRRPGTAARGYRRSYPYFGSAAAMEAAQGYPPGDSLIPDTYSRGARPSRTFYGDEY